MTTIITATYNRPKELARCIRSVNAQTSEDWEHLIIFDGQADPETKAVIKKYEDDRRYFYELPKHTGKDSAPKNKGILEAGGDYICYLDDDNEYLPNFIETLTAEIEIGDDDVVYGDMRIFGKGTGKDGVLGINMEYDAQFLLNRCFIDSGMALHKASAIKNIGGWDETLPRFKDWNVWVRMSKSGMKFRHIPIYLTKYHITKNNSAALHPVREWKDPQTEINMYDPTWWNPSSCYIWGPWLGTKEPEPTVGIFTITKDRLAYTQKMWECMTRSTEYPFSWYVFDNGSTDGTPKWLDSLQARGAAFVQKEDKNMGISYASNALLDRMESYDLILKVDNDVLFLTKGWLEIFVDLWKRNRKLYLGPYPEGLVDSPGGPLRVGASTIGKEYVEVTTHISGMCTFIDARAYKDFRWKDEFLHGNQDMEFSDYVREQGYMPAIIPRCRVQHMETSRGQADRYPEYFEQRKKEKTTKL